MTRIISFLVAILLLAMSSLTSAADDEAARRAADLAAQLRCLVCQNQSIAESNAELAVDLRRQIDEQIRAGKSDREIVDYMVARYGDFVLYRPPFKTSTVFLWLGPAALAVLAFLVFARTVRSRRVRIDAPDLSSSESAEAQRLLADGNDRADKR